MSEQLNQLVLQGNQAYIDGDYQTAKTCFEQVLGYETDNFILQHNLALTYARLGEEDKAIKMFSYPISKGYIESLIGRGSCYRNIKKYKEAAIDFGNAFLLNPNHSHAYSNYGNSLREFGRADLAVKFLEIARMLNPNAMDIKLNLAVAHLLNGDYPNGWEYYDARWYYESSISFKPQYPGTEFDGSQDVTNKIVFVYGEQGLGDQIQFSRYINLIKQKANKVIFLCRKPLLKFFQYNFPDVEVIDNIDTPVHYHYHVPLMSLPKIFGTTIHNVPYPQKYMSVDADIIKKWHDKLGPKKKLRVGICWSPTKVAYISRFRRMDLQEMLCINNPNIELYNLCYDTTDEEKSLMKEHKIIDYSNEVGDFMENAGLVSNLDLVVTVDTVTSHLAGSLGVPTWITIADYAMDWRWMLDRTDSPFYSCVKLFRQKGDNTWGPVLEEIHNILEKIG